MLETTTASHADNVLICLFGSFRLVLQDMIIPVRTGGKTEALLSCLALREGQRMSRDALVDLLWPEADPVHASQSLTTLVHAVRRLLGGGMVGAPPVLYEEGCYALNSRAGVAVDVARFDALASAGERSMRGGDAAGAVRSWKNAVGLYRGDVCTGIDVQAIIERERLRAMHLTLLARLAHHHLQAGEHHDALEHARRLLKHDPCREDAHRLVMRCHVRLGERAQALRQYYLCRQILEREFGATPEPSTEVLFARVRLHPASV